MNECTSCGNTVKTNDKFCTTCGTVLAAGKGALTRDKKARVMSQERKWQKPILIAAITVAAIGAFWFSKGMFLGESMGDRPQFTPLRDASVRTAKATLVRTDDGIVRIPLATINDGNAHFFAYQAQGRTITFFVMRAADGSIRTAYDACMACNHAKLGYRQEGGRVVCNNCGMGFDPAEIGRQKGGCNPIPVDRTVDGQMIVLKAKDLEAGTQYF